MLALICLFLRESTLQSQGYPPLPPGGYYISCPYGLSPGFANGYGGIYYMGYEFDAEWRSNRSDFPLPSLNWYSPVGQRDVMSRDGRAIWKDAQIRVACWITNLLDALIYHFDPIGYSGKVQPCGNAGQPGNTLYAEYDPYDPAADDSGCSDATSSSGSGGSGIQFQPGDHTNGETVDWNTGIGNGGDSVCGYAAVVEYVCIWVWNDIGQKWDKFACGYATTC